MALSLDCAGPPSPAAALSVTDRRGVDLNPLTAPEDAERLRTYLWADQPERLTLTNAALALLRAHIDRADAADWLEQRLAASHMRSTHFLFHTKVWQYFPDSVQTR